MNITLYRYITLLVVAYLLAMLPCQSQNGKIISKSPITITDTTGFAFHNIKLPADYDKIMSAVEVSRITYLSDGLKVNGYVAVPRKEGKYPCIIYNRSGVHDFAIMTDAFAQRLMGEMASWGYVVIETQLRGCGGSQGKEEIGGSEINDVLNLIPALASTGRADTSRIGMYGRSRGGYSTYVAIKRSKAIDAAIIIGGNANFKVMFAERPRLDSIYCELIPGCQTNKEKALKMASPVNWADQLPKNVPLLILHGAKDERVPTAEAFEMIANLHKNGNIFRFVFFENANHGITQFRDEVDRLTRSWFEMYLKVDRGGK